MPVLALDTSAEIVVGLLADAQAAASAPVGGPTPGVAALALPELLAERRVAEPRRHAELLAPMIAEVLAEAGCVPGDVTAVVVGTGPAPFTGLRAGLVTARTFALTLGVPVHGVCSLDVLAAQALLAPAAPAATGGDVEVLVVTDARRREVYAARYRAAAPHGPRAGDLDVLAGPEVDHAVALAHVAARPEVQVVGPAADLYPDDLPAAPGGPRGLDPAVLAGLARARAARGEPQPTEPLYLRRPDVTPSAGRKRATA